MAVTHTEVYRPYEGELKRARLPWWPIAATGISLAWKKKLPILLLFIPVGIATIVHCFMVYTAFMLEDQVSPSSPQQMLLAAVASQLLNVRWIISEFNFVVGHFSLLVMAWFGAGLICEDRRVNAHLLYFARPIKRLDYLLGKLTAVGFWGICTSLVSGLIICLVATFTSPDWVFLTEQYGTIFLTIAYSLTWILTVSSICLAVSSVMPRKSFALIGIIALFMLSSIVAEILTHVMDNELWGLISPTAGFDAIRLWIFDKSGSRDPWSTVWPYLAAVVSYSGISWTVLAFRIRRLEVVA